MDIKYDIGDKIKFKYSQYDDDEGCCTESIIVGYIFAIEINREQGYVSKKKGYKVRYKVHHDYEGLNGGWRYVWENSVIEKLGEHHNKNDYITKL